MSPRLPQTCTRTCSHPGGTGSEVTGRSKKLYEANFPPQGEGEATYGHDLQTNRSPSSKY